MATSGQSVASKGVWEEYDQIVRSSENIAALGPTMFGDQSNLQNGALSFSVTDVSLKGNSALPVTFTRTFATKTKGGAMKGTLATYNLMDGALGDWEIDLPRVGGVYASSTGWINSAAGKAAQRCSVASVSEGSPPNLTVGSSSFISYEYWHGTRLNIPGRGSQAMLVANASSPKPSGSTAYWVTSDLTSVACLSSVLNSTGEGFIATTPDGTRYWFNWMAMAHETELTKQRISTTGYDHLPRRRMDLYATRVEDRFGNWVTYTYSNGATSPVRLSEINASDGRRITVGHNASGFVQSVSAHGRTWNYAYSGGTSGSLTSVTQPDGSAWSINLSTLQSLSMRYIQGEPGEQWRNCTNPGDLWPETYVGSVTHPSGATAEFTLEQQRFVRDGVYDYYPQNCALGKVSDSNDDSEWYPSVWDAYSLVSKKITGPALPAATWSYTYNAGYSTEVVGPNDFTRYTYGNTFRQNEGKLIRVERGASANQILSTENYTYELAQTGMPYPTPLGGSPQVRGDDFTDEYPRPQKQRTVTQQGATFTQSVTGFDSKFRAPGVTKSSSLGYSRSETTEYFDDPSRWVLGQVSRSTTAGIETARTEFNANSLPWRTYAFGKLQQTLTYNADGTVATVTDGRSNAVTLSSWKRGIPQLIQYPATPDSPSGSTESAVVNDSGWITAVTDENGYATGYGYDAMGRLASVTYPSGEGWNNTTRSFQQVWSSEYGIPAGHWKQTTSTGNGVKVSYFDAMWRPLVEESYDAGDAVNTRSVAVKRYDADGRPVFQSYPVSSLSDYAAVTQGNRTFYDALGRVTRAEQDSELGVLATTTAYLSGLQTQVTNPRGHATITAYQAYDEPTLDMPVVISHPEGAYTDIYRDAFGKTTALRRRNADSSQSVWRRYVYDSYQQLCKTIEPETGATVMDYDGAGNLAWSAAGLSLTSTTNCNRTEAYGSGRRVDRSHDARNRIATLLFPDGRGNQSWSYEKDGAVASIATNNSNGGDQVINRYTYNKRRLLTGESVEQPGWYTWASGYGYNANGHLAAQTFPPTGLTVDYAPNALGQATKAGTYATGVSYYPNGAVKQFTYGNGIVHTMTQNARQLPQWSTDSGVINYETSFDANGNATAILDHARGSTYSRWMSYDGLDRLTDAGSASFGGDHWHRFTYDTLDNLKTWKLGGVKDHNYYYDPNENRLTNINNSAGAGIVGLGYDVQGNLQQRNGQGYQFDYGNRLREVTGKEYYRYDGHGRRVLAWTPTTGSILSQYSQTGQLVFQQDQRQNKNIDHVYLAGSLVATREYNLGTGATSVRYQHTDALGSPVAVTNESGQVVERTQFEPFGAAINKTIQGVGYTGHVMDAVTGLTYMQQRYYDPTIGRFLSVDPVTANANTGANFNRYKYAANNPYRFTDPDGRVDWDMLADSFKLEGAVGLGLQAKVKLGPVKASLGLGDASYGVGTTLSDGYAFQEVAGPSMAIEGGRFGLGYKGSVDRSEQGRHGSLYSEQSSKGGWVAGYKKAEMETGEDGSSAEVSGTISALVVRVKGSIDFGKALKALVSTPSSKSGGDGFQGVYRVEGRIDSQRLDKELSREK